MNKFIIFITLISSTCFACENCVQYVDFQIKSLLLGACIYDDDNLYNQILAYKDCYDYMIKNHPDQKINNIYPYVNVPDDF
jgi:hypothetical protein